MTELIKYMLLEGYTPSVIIDLIERYYASFPASKRVKVGDTDCPQLGDPKAKVVVVEFSDFQCPHCAAAEKPLRDLVTALPGQVRLCSKYFPLPGHPRARQAAAAAEYAFRHNKFWEMSEMLFAHQDTDELDDAHAWYPCEPSTCRRPCDASCPSSSSSSNRPFSSSRPFARCRQPCCRSVAPSYTRLRP